MGNSVLSEDAMTKLLEKLMSVLNFLAEIWEEIMDVPNWGGGTNSWCLD